MIETVAFAFYGVLLGSLIWLYKMPSFMWLLIAHVLFLLIPIGWLGILCHQQGRIMNKNNKGRRPYNAGPCVPQAAEGRQPTSGSETVTP